MRTMQPKTILAGSLLAAAGLAGVAPVSHAAGQAGLTDEEMAHVAVTASEIDIAYAGIALEKSRDPEVRAFAETMIRDHSAVNDKVAALAERLGVTARDNDVSRGLMEQAKAIRAELEDLDGAAFDRRYAENEASYHGAVNGVVADTFIPNARHPEIKAAFETALQIFLAHQQHAERLALRTRTAS